MGLKADEESVWLNIMNSFQDFKKTTQILIIINKIQNSCSAGVCEVRVHIVYNFQAWLEKIILDNFLLTS